MKAKDLIGLKIENVVTSAVLDTDYLIVTFNKEKFRLFNNSNGRLTAVKDKSEHKR